MVAWIDDVPIFWVDDALKNASSISIGAILTKTAGPRTTELEVTATALSAQGIPLVGPCVGPIIAHNTFASCARPPCVAAI